MKKKRESRKLDAEETGHAGDEKVMSHVIACRLRVRNKSMLRPSFHN